MFSKRLVRAAMLSILLLGVLAASAFAAPDVGDASKETTRINRRNVTIPWFEWVSPVPNKLTHDICPAIPEGYVIVPDDLGSLRRKTATRQVMANGNIVVKIRDVVRGTATDNYGDSYRWAYRQNLWITVEDGVATAKITDYFRVAGPDVFHEVGFKFRWQYYATDVNVVEVVEGDEVIDTFAEFIWPTDDGTTETTNPDFIDGSWKVDYDFGDWTHCDPV